MLEALRSLRRLHGIRPIRAPQNAALPQPRQQPRLAAEERALFDDLRDNRIGKSLRLEQERVGFQWVTHALSRVSGAATR